MPMTDLGSDWYAEDSATSGSLMIRNDVIGEAVLLPADSVRRLKRIIVQAAMAIVDKTLVEAYADPMSDDEKAARERGWFVDVDGSGVVHPCGRWAPDFTAALMIDVTPDPSDDIPF